MKYEQFILVLKNKFVNIPNEDIVLLALELWISTNNQFF